MRLFLAFSLVILCAFSPVRSPATSATQSPVGVLVAETGIPVSGYQWVSELFSNVQCELETVTFSSGSQTWTNKGTEGTNCDFWIGTDGTVEREDPYFVEGSPNYFDFEDKDDLLNGTERLTSKTVGSGLPSCANNAHRPSTNTTVIYGINAGPCDHQFDPIGFQTTGSSTRMGYTATNRTMPINQFQFQVKNTSNNNSVIHNAGNYGCTDEFLVAHVLEMGASTYTSTVYSNSKNGDIQTGSYSATPTDTAIDGQINVGTSPASENGPSDTGKVFYFACIEDALTSSEIGQVFDNLEGKYASTFIPATPAGGMNVLTAGVDDVNFDMTSQAATIWDLKFSSTGLNSYGITATGDTIYQYVHSTAYDVSTMSYDSKSLSVTSNCTFPDGIHWNSDDTGFWCADGGDNDAERYTCTAAGEINTCTHAANIPTASKHSWLTGVWVNEAETIAITLDNSTEEIHKWTVSGDTWTWAQTHDLGADTNGAAGLSVNADISQIYWIDATGDYIKQVNLSTPADLSTISFQSQKKYVNNIATQPLGLDVVLSENRVVVVGNGIAHQLTID